MRSKKILITRVIPEDGITLLKAAGFDVTARTNDTLYSQEELIALAKQHNAILCTVTDKIDAHFLNECKHLDIISQFAVGYDNINILEATKLGIPVGFTPYVLNDATADIAFGLMLAASRKMFHLHKMILKGEWDYFRPSSYLGIELKNKTLGIFGLGRIGLEMAKRCQGAYNMKIIYYNRGNNAQAEKELNAKRVSFDELLQQSDVISVHCALTEETKGIFNKEAFAKMKPSSLFVNTSRGGVHIETDLIDALQNNIIWGAGLDVTNPEPMHPNNPLLTMENVAVLPHIGSASMESRAAMSVSSATNIIEFYQKGIVPNCVNPEVLAS